MWYLIFWIFCFAAWVGVWIWIFEAISCEHKWEEISKSKANIVYVCTKCKKKRTVDL